MRRMTYFVMAFALVLGLSQCKKEQPLEPENETKTVNITLKVSGNGGSRHDINTTTGAVDFKNGDVIYVGDGSTYIGTLTKSGEVFSGDINEPANETEIYFFFVGGFGPSPNDLTQGTTPSFTVDISDQSTTMPVLSCNHVTYTTGTTSYSCVLQNQCALVKFTTASTTADVRVGGLYTEAQINFASHSITNTDTKGFVNLYPDADDDMVKWAVLLPQTSFSGIEGVVADKGYTMQPQTIISADDFITGDDFSISSTPSHNRYLQWATGDLTLEDGDHVYGTLGGNYKVSIADGATVTLDGVTINGDNDEESEWAGITCLGNATIILSGENTVKGFLDEYPGIFVPENSSLIINGTGSLDASSNGWASGIGAGYDFDCGNIEIRGGIITATGGEGAAGIGSGPNDSFGSTCGTITISGGTVTANGGDDAAGIGCGSFGTCGDISISGGTIFATGAGDGAGIGCDASGICGNISITGGIITATGSGIGAGIGTVISSECGTITIANTVTSVTATKGLNAANSIGKGTTGAGTCVAVKFGGQTMYDGSSWTTTPTNGGTYGGLSLAITTTGFTNDTWTLTPYVAPVVPTGAIDAQFNVGTVESPKWVYFSEGNLQYTQSTTTWSFMEHQYDMVETTGMNVGTNYANQDIVSLFCWGTGNNPTKTGGGAAEYEIFTDWGTNTIYSGTTATSGWRTLTRDEWNNLFANHQYGYVMIFNGSQLICGVAIDPSSTTSLNTSHNNWSNNLYTTGLDAFIADAEAGGWLFLPAAGLRSGTNVSNVGTVSSCAGYYWSSTNEYNSLLGCYQSHYVWFNGSGDAESSRSMGFIGYSVRLVKDAE